MYVGICGLAYVSGKMSLSVVDMVPKNTVAKEDLTVLEMGFATDLVLCNDLDMIQGQC